MQGKLTVQFHGEEGIDAGGVTREWYMVGSLLQDRPAIELAFTYQMPSFPGLPDDTAVSCIT